MNEEDKNQERISPPYVSYATFSSAVASLAEHGVPPQLDRSVFPNFAGSVKRQLMQAFRFMGLVDSADRSTDKLQELTNAEADRRKEILAAILQNQFPEQVAILKNGTAQQLRNSFDSIGIEQSVKDKCIAFLLNAAKDAGLEISPHILRRKSTRVSSSRISPRRENQRKKEVKGEEERAVLPGASIKPGQITIPIPLRPGKVWAVHLDPDYSASDVERFMKILEMVLLEEVEEDEIEMKEEVPRREPPSWTPRQRAVTAHTEGKREEE